MSNTSVENFAINAIAKREISMRYWLQGSKFYTALQAMSFAAKYHTGVRKDGFTPEFDHQISIAHYVRTIHTSLQFPEETIATVFLHDVREDYGVSNEEILNLFGSKIAYAVDCMTKTFRGVKRTESEVFQSIAEDPIASIAKGADRIQNFDSMVGVFTTEKQISYLQEGEQLFLPMIKTARRLHVIQEPAYENIKTMLVSQIKLIRAIHNSQW